jgi:hypothetical protein
MLLVLLAGLNALFFWIKVTPLISGPSAKQDLPTFVKLCGFSSLLMWTGVLCFGRLIPYLGTG